MQAHIAKREKETGRTNPIYTNLNWHGHGGPFKTSQQAYDTLHIGSPKAAQALQAKELQTQRGAEEALGWSLTNADHRHRPRPLRHARHVAHALRQRRLHGRTAQRVRRPACRREDMYEACRVHGAARAFTWAGWSGTSRSSHTMPIDPEFTRLVESYLASVLASDADRKGWKLPETTLVYPWIVRMFPDIHYIHWVRDPRDSHPRRATSPTTWPTSASPTSTTDDLRLRRAISWKYQREIVQATPRAAALDPGAVRGLRPAPGARRWRGWRSSWASRWRRSTVHADRIGRWKLDGGVSTDFDFFADEMAELGYEMPDPSWTTATSTLPISLRER